MSPADLRIVVLSLCLAGCNLQFGRDTFDTQMQAEVGKTADDPDSYRARNPSMRVGSTPLRNGNVEEEYQAGFRSNCRVFFEVDKSTRKVVGWRFGQPDDDCYLSTSISAPEKR
jgi:hypothetical protein